jgi:hypothetical protein
MAYAVRWDEGFFDWRTTGHGKGNGGVTKDIYATEEEYMATMPPNRLRKYLETRQRRYERWFYGHRRQRWLRLRRMEQRKREYEQVQLFNKTFKPLKIKDTTIPADVPALFHLVYYRDLHNEKSQTQEAS